MSEEQRRAYDHYLDTQVRDTDVLKTQLLEARIEGLKLGRKEGREEGREEGRKEGRKEVKLLMARSLKADNMDIAFIMKHTGLSAEEIESL